MKLNGSNINWTFDIWIKCYNKKWTHFKIHVYIKVEKYCYNIATNINTS